MEPIEAAGFAYKSHMLPFYIAKLFVSNSELYWVKFSLSLKYQRLTTSEC